MDARLRELEQRWRASQSKEDGIACLRAWQRAGEIDEEGVRLASWCGLPAARALVETDPRRGFVDWFRGLGDRAAMAIAVAALVRDASQLDAPRAQRLAPMLPRLEAWLLDPGREAAEAFRTATRPSMPSAPVRPMSRAELAGAMNPTGTYDDDRVHYAMEQWERRHGGSLAEQEARYERQRAAYELGMFAYMTQDQLYRLMTARDPAPPAASVAQRIVRDLQAGEVNDAYRVMSAAVLEAIEPSLPFDASELLLPQAVWASPSVVAVPTSAPPPPPPRRPAAPRGSYRPAPPHPSGFRAESARPEPRPDPPRRWGVSQRTVRERYGSGRRDDGSWGEALHDALLFFGCLGFAGGPLVMVVGLGLSGNDQVWVKIGGGLTLVGVVAGLLLPKNEG